MLVLGQKKISLLDSVLTDYMNMNKLREFIILPQNIP